MQITFNDVKLDLKFYLAAKGNKITYYKLINIKCNIFNDIFH